MTTELSRDTKRSEYVNISNKHTHGLLRAKRLEIEVAMINRSHCYSHQGNQPIYAYTLHAGATVVRVSNYGATLLSIETPDVHGDYDDIVLGFDAIDAYASDLGACFGATVGPVANRTAHGEVPLGETVFRMTLNDHGCNNLHTDLDHGLHKRMWSQKEFSQKPHKSARLVLQCSLADNELGLPGNRRISALFELDQARTLTITYRMETDAPTYADITNHTYFNLAGTSSVSVLTEMVALEADEFVVIDKNSIPIGELRSVEGTPFDFRTLHPLGAQIEAPDEQLSFAHGYDHCFCVRNPGEKIIRREEHMLALYKMRSQQPLLFVRRCMRMIPTAADTWKY